MLTQTEFHTGNRYQTSHRSAEHAGQSACVQYIGAQRLRLISPGRDTGESQKTRTRKGQSVISCIIGGF